jgi:heat shock protein HslJ
MRILRHVSVGAMVGVMVAGFGGPATGNAAMGSAAEVNRLAGSEWRPTRLGGQAIPATTNVFVQFKGEGRMAGHAGCNRFFGTYRVSGDAIRISPLPAAARHCPEMVMVDEVALLSALAQAVHFRRERIVLHLIGRDGNTLAEFAQTDWD